MAFQQVKSQPIPEGGAFTLEADFDGTNVAAFRVTNTTDLWWVFAVWNSANTLVRRVEWAPQSSVTFTLPAQVKARFLDVSAATTDDPLNPLRTFVMSGGWRWSLSNVPAGMPVASVLAK